MAKFFYNKEITLLKETEGYLYHGSWIEGTIEPVKDIVCDVQPSNKELIYREYGYYIDCTKRIFCDVDADIVEGDLIEYEGVRFRIEKLITWDDYYDIFIKEVE